MLTPAENRKRLSKDRAEATPANLQGERWAKIIVNSQDIQYAEKMGRAIPGKRIERRHSATRKDL